MSVAGVASAWHKDAKPSELSFGEQGWAFTVGEGSDQWVAREALGEQACFGGWTGKADEEGKYKWGASGEQMWHEGSELFGMPPEKQASSFLLPPSLPPPPHVFPPPHVVPRPPHVVPPPDVTWRRVRLRNDGSRRTRTHKREVLLGPIRPFKDPRRKKK